MDAHEISEKIAKLISDGFYSVAQKENERLSEKMTAMEYKYHIDRVKKYESKMSNGTYCSQCERGGFGPTHDGSRFCKSGSIRSGGNKAHCTCDVCF